MTTDTNDEMPLDTGFDTRFDLANRLFFRLYQCANMMHKTGSRALEDEGLTTQRWAVLGALSRDTADGMAIGDLARYLKVSRQSLAGVISRLEADGLIATTTDTADRRSRLVRMTPLGEERWVERALPRIAEFYSRSVQGLSTEDLSHALHYLVRLLDNMTAIDDQIP